MTTFKANRKFPNPITVTDDPKSHTLALQQIIEALNVGQRRTREIDSSYVRVHELVDVGLIEIVGNQLKLTNAGTAAAAAGVSALADLTDVDLTGLADGETLVWDSGAGMWVPGAASSGPITGADMYDVSLNDLADVAFSAPLDKQTLSYDAASGVWTTNFPGVLPFAGVKAVLTANQTISGAPDTVEWSGTEYDTNGYWSAGSTTRITIPAGGEGKYQFNVHTAVTGASDYDLQIFKNGTLVCSDYCSGNYAQYTMTHIEHCVAGDYFEVKAKNNNSTTFVGAAAGSQRSYFAATRLSGYTTGMGLTHPDAPPAVPDPMDDEFEGTTLSSKWVWRNQGTSTATLKQGVLVHKPQGTAGVNSLRILEQTVTGSFKVRTKVTMVNNGTVAGSGLCVSVSSTGKTYGFYPVTNNSSSAISLDRFTNATTYAGTSPLNDTGFAGWGCPTAPIYLEIEYDGTTLYFRYSFNGAEGTFRTMYSEAAATWLGTPDRVGILSNAPISSPDVYASYDWFRKISSTYEPGKLLVNSNYVGNELLPAVTSVPTPPTGYLRIYAGYEYDNAVPIMTSNTAPSGTVSADSSYFAAGEYTSFDRNSSSGWIAQNTAYPHWLQYQFPTAKTVKLYGIVPWSYDSWPDRNPTGWILKGSNDGTNWTDLDTRSVAIGSWVRYTETRFTIANPQSFTYYRLHITANGGNLYVGIGELALYVDGSTTPVLLVKDPTGAVNRVSVTAFT